MTRSVARCPRCGQSKSLEEFARNRSTSTGRGAYCKPCHNEVVRANRDKNHGGTRNFLLKHRYGIEGYEVAWQMLRQRNVCLICGQNEPKHVDHDHATGKVRGVLCFNCNRALGYVTDDSISLYGLADYLEERATEHPALQRLQDRSDL